MSRSTGNTLRHADTASPGSGLRLVAVRAILFSLIAAVLVVGSSEAEAQTSFPDPDATGAWNTARWNNSTDGPTYTETYTANNDVIFTTSGTYSFAGMGASINVGNITVNAGANVNFPSVGSTFATGGNVRTIDVAAGSTLDFASQSFSTTAGTGFVKNGNGVLALAGNTYGGGFTLNDGVVILRGVNAMGGAAGNTLALNGGVVASNANRDLTGKFAGGISIGGNVQFGAFAADVTLAGDDRNLTFSNNVDLGGATRTLTLGNRGNMAFGGVISNGSLTFASIPGTEASVSGNGRFDITNTANTFTGDIQINGPEVRFTADGSLGNAANSIVIDGGRFGAAGTFTLGGDRGVFVGDTPGTSISTPGTNVLTINAAIADIAGKTGSWSKQGGSTLVLGGASTYTGETLINNGVVQLAGGSDRLPTSTVVRLGQAASSNVGTLDLNGQDQAIAGLASTAGTNSGAARNTVSSTAAATLTINLASGTAQYGFGTPANSGVIGGAVSLVKQGNGTQILGDANTYTGTTLIEAGLLLIEGEQSGTGQVTVGSAGALGGAGSIAGSLVFEGNGSGFLFDPLKTLTVNGSGVSFLDTFGIADLIGFSSAVADGVYQLLDGTALVQTSNLANFGPGNPFALDGGRSAYFVSSGTGLAVQVVPEPSSLVLTGLGLLAAGYALRRRKLASRD
jgi:fibronectin-binding autotransporter adhesin